MRCLAVIACVVGFASIAHAQVELKNDGFTANATVGYQSGFCNGEIAASRFIAPEDGRQLRKVRFLFGSATDTKQITIYVWDDTAGTNGPGMELFRSDYQVTGSANGIIESDMTEQNIIVPAQFRVGVMTKHMGQPFVARDDDAGSQNDFADRNYILADAACNAGGPFTWFRASTLGVQGDWVIRAEISTGPITPTDAGAPDSGVGGPPTGDPCNGNAQCPIGQYCDLASMTCTYDCANDDACGTGQCNSLGQCVAGGEGGGCGCRAHEGELGVWLVLGIAFVIVRRRKR